MVDHTVADSSRAPVTHHAPDRKAPTPGQIAQDYAQALAIIDGLRCQRDELLAALIVAERLMCDADFDMEPQDDEGYLAIMQARTAILHAEPPRSVRDEAP